MLPDSSYGPQFSRSMNEGYRCVNAPADTQPGIVPQTKPHLLAQSYSRIAQVAANTPLSHQPPSCTSLPTMRNRAHSLSLLF
jgi:hypothetical protein